MSIRKAIYWSIFWIALSLAVNAGIYLYWGHQKGVEFLTGYLIEKSLSVDNLFVFLIIFGLFDVKLSNQRKVLNWGIIGVLILRGALIYLGVALVGEFQWILYLFGLLLVYTGIHITFGEEKKINPQRNIVVRLFRKIMPVEESYVGKRFFVRKKRVLYATPLLIVLIIIETTDVVFAFDSIPAILAITTDPIIVLSSNMLAVLGLRSLYFVLVEVHANFAYVKYGVAIVLVYIGLKMLVVDIVKIDTIISLGVVVCILTSSVLLSYLKKGKDANVSEIRS
jgi:tellurite resistance protein TerC